MQLILVFWVNGGIVMREVSHSQPSQTWTGVRQHMQKPQEPTNLAIEASVFQVT